MQWKDTGQQLPATPSEPTRHLRQTDRHPSTKGEYQGRHLQAPSHHRMGTPNELDDRGKSARKPHRLQVSPPACPRRRTCGKTWRTGAGVTSRHRNSVIRRKRTSRKGVHVVLMMNEGEGPRDRRRGSQRECKCRLRSTPFYLSWNGEFDQAAFNSLSDKMQAIIKLSPEYQQLSAAPFGTREDSTTSRTTFRSDHDHHLSRSGNHRHR